MKPQQKNSKKDQTNHKLIKYIDWTLLITIIIILAWIYYNKYYVDINIIETCYGIPQKATGQIAENLLANLTLT